MKKIFSRSWIASRQPRKQRKYKYNAPLNLRRKMMSASLSKDLRSKYKKRNIVLAKGDKVKIMVGTYKGIIGEVTKLNYVKYKAYITGAERTKKDGPKIQYPIHPSNLQIITPKLEDKRRVAMIEKAIRQRGKHE